MKDNKLLLGPVCGQFGTRRQGVGSLVLLSVLNWRFSLGQLHAQLGTPRLTRKIEAQHTAELDAVRTASNMGSNFLTMGSVFYR